MTKRSWTDIFDTRLPDGGPHIGVLRLINDLHHAKIHGMSGLDVTSIIMSLQMELGAYLNSGQHGMDQDRAALLSRKFAAYATYIIRCNGNMPDAFFYYLKNLVSALNEAAPHQHNAPVELRLAS